MGKSPVYCARGCHSAQLEVTRPQDPGWLSVSCQSNRTLHHINIYFSLSLSICACGLETGAPTRIQVCVLLTSWITTMVLHTSGATRRGRTGGRSGVEAQSRDVRSSFFWACPALPERTEAPPAETEDEGEKPEEWQGLRPSPRTGLSSSGCRYQPSLQSPSATRSPAGIAVNASGMIVVALLLYCYFACGHLTQKSSTCMQHASIVFRAILAAQRS